MNEIKITDMRHLPGDSAFLCDDGKTSILYDTGFAFTGEKIAQKLHDYLGKRSLDYILLTHSHYDHALGSVYIKKQFKNCRVIACQYAANIFEKPSARAVMRKLDKSYAEKCGIKDYPDYIDELGVDICVSDGQKLMLGDIELTAIHLPGHTRCSYGFYLQKQKMLLSCETLGVYGGLGIVLPSFLIGYQTTLESIKKAALLDVSSMLSPHHGLLDKDKTRDFLLQSHDSAVSTAQFMKEALIDGKSIDEVVSLYREKIYHGYVKTIYPIDAMLLNTSIMARLVNDELVKNNQGK